MVAFTPAEIRLQPSSIADTLELIVIDELSPLEHLSSCLIDQLNGQSHLQAEASRDLANDRSYLPQQQHLSTHGICKCTDLCDSVSSNSDYGSVQGLADDADINSEDPEVVRRGQALLDSALQKTHEMGGTHMVGVIYSALKKYPGPCSPASRQNVVTSLQVWNVA